MIAAASVLWLGGLAEPTWAHDLGLELAQFRLARWDSDNGLPSSSVNAVAQTNDGYLWFGTYSGLARFDGVRFTVFDHANRSLPHNEVLSLLATKDGVLWVGTPRGAARYARGRFEIIGPDKGLPEAPIAAFTESGGRIWAAVRNRGLYVLENGLENGRFHAVGPPGLLAGNRAHTLEPAPEGGVWVAGEIGVVQISTSGAMRNAGSEEIGPVRLIFADNDGSLWAATNDGELLRLRKGVWETHPIPGLQLERKLVVLCMLRDRAGTLWIGTDNSGLIGVSAKRVRVYKDSTRLPELRITGLLEDTEGGLWLGTPSFGVVELREGSVTPYGRSEGMDWDVTLSVMQTRDGTVWAGVDGGGLNLLEDGHWRVISAPKVLGGTAPYTMLEARDGSVWVGTDNEMLHQFRNKTLTQKLKIPGYPGTPGTLAEDSEGTLWVGAAHGLYRLRGGRWQIMPNTSGPPWRGCEVSAIVPGDAGDMTVATDAGLWKRINGQFVVVKGTEGQNVTALLRDSRGALWATIDGVGLIRIQSGHIARFGAADGLPETQMVSLVEDGLGKLWMGGARGIYCARLNELERHAADGRSPIAFDEVGLSDGMRARECNGTETPAAWRMHDGSLWFATMRGLVKVDPARHGPSDSNARVIIEAVVVGHQERPVVFPRVQLNPAERDIGFRYTSSSFAAPERLRFRYQLQGYDANWVDAGTRREAFYTNLPPGRYEFVVQAGMRGRWSEEKSSLHLDVVAHWYETPPARAAAGIAILLIAAAVYLVRIRSLRRREERLTAKVDERTRELREEIGERRRAEARSEVLARTKSEFLANMSHEMRTPMNSVIGMTSILMETPLSSEQRECVEVVRASGTHLLAVINDILDYSKVESGTLQLEALPFRIDQCVKEVFDLLSPLAKPKNIQLICAFEEVPVAIRGDITRVRQVLVNFVGNGIKFTRHGEVEVHVYPHENGDPPLLRFEVRDTGIGVPADQQQNLFQAFTQGDSSTTRRFGGTGLGLAICRRLVELMGGTIGMKNNPDVGSTFWFTLPAEAVDASLVPKPARAAGIDMCLAARIPMRILLVEDNPINQKVGTRLLEKLGYHPDVASNGQEALDAVRRQNYDVILMDMQMPVMDGLEASRIVVHEYPPETRPFIVAMTANVLESDREACKKAGMDDFLGKPVLLGDLHKLLERVSVQLGLRREGIRMQRIVPQEQPAPPVN